MIMNISCFLLVAFMCNFFIQVRSLRWNSPIQLHEKLEMISSLNILQFTIHSCDCTKSTTQKHDPEILMESWFCLAEILNWKCCGGPPEGHGFDHHDERTIFNYFTIGPINKNIKVQNIWSFPFKKYWRFAIISYILCRILGIRFVISP